MPTNASEPETRREIRSWMLSKRSGRSPARERLLNQSQSTLMTYCRMRCVLCSPHLMFAQLSESGNLGLRRLAGVAPGASASRGMISCDHVQPSCSACILSMIVNSFFIITIISRKQDLVLLASYHKSPCDVGKPGC